jgi:hypothetical protein
LPNSQGAGIFLFAQRLEVTWWPRACSRNNLTVRSTSCRYLSRRVTSRWHALLVAVRRRIIRLLRRHDIDLAGRFDDGCSDPLVLESPVLAQVQGASVLGRVATGPRAGQGVVRWGSDTTAPLVTTGGPRHAHIEGFDLHANAAVRAGEDERLEHLCRYILRPPVAQDALELTADGKVLLRLRRRVATALSLRERRCVRRGDRR